MNIYDYFIKIILIGDKGVGKTSFIYNYLKKNEKIYSTIGLDYHDKYIDTKNNEYTIKLRIWDTSGQYTYANTIENYFKTCHGFIFFYDISNNESLLNIEKWIERIESFIDGKIYEKNIDYILIGNKSDLNDRINTNDLNRILTKYNFELFTCNNTSNTGNKYITHLIKKILLNQDLTNRELDRNEVSFNISNYDIMINKNSDCCF